MSHYADDRQMFQYDEPHHLNGPMWDKVTKVAKKGYHGAKQTAFHPQQTARETARKGTAFVNRSKQAISNHIPWKSKQEMHESKQEMHNEIDICECSRRVQGHLAIQYPEFH
jgi:hypothetical protein